MSLTSQSAIEAASFMRGYASARSDEQVKDHLLQPLPGQQVPEWLQGQFLRTGPALFDLPKYKVRHWFDGLAMLYRFHFDKGQVRYTNRFLESQAYLKAIAKGELVYREFATVPPTNFGQFLFELFFPHPTDNANISIARLGGQFAALNEGPAPVLFDPASLQTRGSLRFNDGIKATTSTPHPHYDFANRQTIGFTTHFSARHHYNIYRLADGSTSRQLIATIPVKQPSYMHSFAVTENYIVLTQFPLVLGRLDNLIKNYKKPIAQSLEWKPELGTRFIVISKKEGKIVHCAESAPFNAWHHINAFERGNQIFLDICAYNVAELGSELYLEQLAKVDLEQVPQVYLRRYRLSLDSSSVNYEEYADQHFDLPRINYRGYNGREYRYVYGNGYRRASRHDFTNQLVKLDMVTNDSRQWWQLDHYPGEPLFVPRPGATAEDDGVILSVMLNAAEVSSYLLILDGSTFEEIARLKLPYVAPFAFHGLFGDGDELV